MAASHLICGHSIAHQLLEERLAEFVGPHLESARALSFSTGYMANLAILTTLGAGENGYLGREEIDTIAPAIAAAQARGIDARGPYPADTLFQPRHLREADCVLAMYHDQGLPVLKYATFGRGVNITLGLPLIRTSQDPSAVHQSRLSIERPA